MKYIIKKIPEICPICKGRGKQNKRKCYGCKGMGWVMREEHHWEDCPVYTKPYKETGTYLSYFVYPQSYTASFPFSSGFYIKYNSDTIN